LSFEQYLLEVLEREMEARRQGRIERFSARIRTAIGKDNGKFLIVPGFLKKSEPT